MEIEVIIFRVQDHQFGLEVKSINKILTSSINKKTDRLPFEEAEIPIVDLATYLEVNEREKGKKEVIVVEVEGVKKGLLVDEILNILKLNLDQVKLLHSFIKNTASKNYFWAVVQIEEELILLLDIRKIV